MTCNLAYLGYRVVPDDLAILIGNEKASSPYVVHRPAVDVHPNDVASLRSTEGVDRALGHAIKDTKAITAVDQVACSCVATRISNVCGLVD